MAVEHSLTGVRAESSGRSMDLPEPAGFQSDYKDHFSSESPRSTNQSPVCETRSENSPAHRNATIGRDPSPGHDNDLFR